MYTRGSDSGEHRRRRPAVVSTRPAEPSSIRHTHGSVRGRHGKENIIRNGFPRYLSARITRPAMLLRVGGIYLIYLILLVCRRFTNLLLNIFTYKLQENNIIRAYYFRR